MLATGRCEPADWNHGRRGGPAAIGASERYKDQSYQAEIESMAAVFIDARVCGPRLKQEWRRTSRSWSQKTVED